jgi:hypothetical protein
MKSKVLKFGNCMESTRKRVSLTLVLVVVASGMFALGIFRLSGDLSGGGTAQAAMTCNVPIPYATIQAAVNDPTCSTINVASGVYNENVVINRQLVLDGAGAALTIIHPLAAGPAITVFAGGTSVSRLVISHLTTTGSLGGGNVGSGIQFAGSTTISHVTLDGVTSTANSGHGVAIDHTGTMSDLVFTGVNLSNNVTDGFRVPTSLISLDGLMILNSTLERNTTGMEIYAANSATVQPVSKVLIQDTSFNANSSKGFYAERLSDATFRRVSVVGSGTAGGFAAGIDINLKYRAYQNIDVLDSVIRGNGAGDTVNGVGITVKARNDAPSYNTRPATLTGVRLLGNTVAGNTSDGIRFGEPGKNNSGPTDVHVNQNNIETNTVFGLNNQTLALTDGTCNWWGSPTGPTITSNPGGTGDRVSMNVDYTPWLSAPTPVGACIGGASTPGKVTGGGQIQGDPVFSVDGVLLSVPALVPSLADPKGQATFGFVVQCCPATGNLEYNDHSAGVRIKAQSIDGLSISSPGTSCSAPGSQHATFNGTASVIRSTGTTMEPFTVDVDDCGEPGSMDTFGIKTTTYSNEPPKTLIGGNIQIH